ncbi:hypothetical protein K2Z84_10825 [Candidatus Binatia bacterium]|nr:hypothetical protein [Candidatus Binatia bacterium]
MLCASALAGTLAVAATAVAQSVLENPSPGSVKSGIGVLSGWKCSAGGPTAITLTIDDTTTFQAAYGTGRADTIPVCGDADNGFGVLFNFGLLADGEHEIVARDGGVEFARATFSTSRFGVSFLVGASGTSFVRDFPSAGQGAFLVWEEASQSFQVGGTCGATGRPTCPPTTSQTGWAFADQESAGTYTPSGSFNSASQPNTAARTSPGSYRVVLGGLGADGVGGIAHATAHQDDASSCNVEGWAPDMGTQQVDVRCVDGSGAAVDARFDVVWTRPASGPERRAYLWADAPTVSDYVPDLTYQFNSTGALNSIMRLSAGTYRATLPGIATGTSVGVMLSAFGSSGARCRVLDYGLDADARFGVDVECLNAAGSPADTQFTLSAFRDAPLAPFPIVNGAYLRMRNPAAPQVAVAEQYNSVGGTNSVTRLATGRYAARLGMQGGSGANGNVQITAVGTGATHCKEASQTSTDGDAVITVACFAGAAPADAEFLLTYEE